MHYRPVVFIAEMSLYIFFKSPSSLCGLSELPPHCLFDPATSPKMAEYLALLCCASASAHFFLPRTDLFPSFSPVQHSAQTSHVYPIPSSRQTNHWHHVGEYRQRHLLQVLQEGVDALALLLRSIPDNRFLKSDSALCAATAIFHKSQKQELCTFFSPTTGHLSLGTQEISMSSFEPSGTKAYCGSPCTIQQICPWSTRNFWHLAPSCSGPSVISVLGFQHSCSMLDHQWLLSLRWLFELYWYVTHPHRERELCWRRFSDTVCQLLHVNTTLSFATTCILFVRASSHLSSLHSFNGLVSDGANCLPVSFDGTRPSLLPLFLPVLVKVVLPCREQAIKSSHDKSSVKSKLSWNHLAFDFLTGLSDGLAACPYLSKISGTTPSPSAPFHSLQLYSLCCSVPAGSQYLHFLL